MEGIRHIEGELNVRKHITANENDFIKASPEERHKIDFYRKIGKNRCQKDDELLNVITEIQRSINLEFIQFLQSYDFMCFLQPELQ